MTALDNLFQQLPDLELAVPEASLSWRPGPFNRALVALPARFTPASPSAAPAPAAPTVATAPATPEVPSAPAGKPGRWSQFLSWLTG